MRVVEAVLRNSLEDSLRKRILLSIGAIAASLILIVAVGAQTLSSSQSHSRFSILFAQLSQTTARLEAELALAIADQSGQQRAAGLATKYRDALAAFTVLRATDPVRDLQSTARWAALEAEYRIDASAERARFGLAPDSMPQKLRALSQGGDGSAANLEEAAAEFLTLTRMIVAADGAYTSEHTRNFEAARNLSGTKLFPVLDHAQQLLTERNGQNAISALAALLGCVAALVMATALSALYIGRPMQRAIAEYRQALVEEKARSDASKRGSRALLAMLVHELRTPMNGLVGLVNLLLDTNLDAQQKEYARTIKESGDGLVELLREILDLSRIESSSLQLADANFSITDIVAEIVKQLGPQASAKRLEVSAYIEPTLPEMLRGDSGRIRKILVNLVSNAVKFTTSGGIAIEVRHEGGNDETGYSVSICVADTGIGIANEQLVRIFDRVIQVDTSSNRRLDGSGLGLSISRELAWLMGGEIGVESTLDQGSTFWVRLPLAAACPPAGRIAERSKASFAGRRFLVVDDNALARRIFRLQLEAYGAEVECVPDAYAALAALAQGENRACPYDLAIIDPIMPETDGLTLRKTIREHPQHARLKLIISSSGGIAFDQQARALGFDAACPKPVVQETLIRKIQELLAPNQVQLIGAPVIALPAKAAPAAPVEVAQHRQPLLLVAEDNPINQRFISTVLKHAGFAIDMVGDGVEAVHAVKRQAYDLVLMDIRMPVMNGLEATQRIRALPEATARVPIIAMTANAMLGDREEYLAAGMDDYVAKPIDFNILLAKIRAHLPTDMAAEVAGTAEIAPWKPHKMRV